ncbi:MAG: tetratricopeptide repeat protein [Gemmatales bacterium]
MGFFDKLLGRKSSANKPMFAQPASVDRSLAKHSAAVVLAPSLSGKPYVSEVKKLDPAGMMLCYEQQGMKILLDCDAFEYQFGEKKGTNPAQQDLDALWPRVTRVCVLEGCTYRGCVRSSDVLLNTKDARAIEKLADCMKISEDPGSFKHCACLGGPAMEFYSGSELMAIIGLHHGHTIRWKRWHDDATLLDGERLSQWLVDQGIARPRLEKIYQRSNNFIFEPEELPPLVRQAEESIAQAQQCMIDGHPQLALAHCDQALRFDPEHRGGYALRGVIHFHLGQNQEALADLMSSIERGFRHDDTFFKTGVLLMEAGRIEEGSAACAQALWYNPENPGALNERGLARARQNQLNEAYDDFTSAIRLLPKWVGPRMHRGMVQHQRGQLEAAIKDFDDAIELMKTQGHMEDVKDSRVILATLYGRRGDVKLDQFRESEAEADFALAREQHLDATQTFLCGLWMRRGEHQKVDEVMSAYLANHPEDPQGYMSRGQAREILGHHEGAVEDYSAALRYSSEKSAGYFFRARTRLRQKRKEEALADVNEYLRLVPGDAGALFMRSKIYQEKGAFSQSIQDKNATLHAAPDQPDFCNSLAWLLATCREDAYRDGPRAVALARHACEVTNYAGSHYLDTLAAALAEAGEFEEAIHWQTKAVEQTSLDEPSGRRARLALYQARKAYRE